MTSPLVRLIKDRVNGRVVSITRTTQPSNVPLLTVAKTQLAIGSSDTTHDVLLQRLIDAAVQYVENAARRSMFDQGWTLVLDSFPDEDFIDLYMPPVKTVSSFTTYDYLDAADTTFNKYSVDVNGTRVLLNYGYQWPVNLRTNSAVKIVYTTGYGTSAAALPPTLVQAVMLLVGQWFANRDASGCGVTAEMANSVTSILGLERILRI